MKCEVQGCQNEARYIAVDGFASLQTCALCPIKLKLFSIRVSDVAGLILLARDLICRTTANERIFECRCGIEPDNELVDLVLHLAEILKVQVDYDRFS